MKKRRQDVIRNLIDKYEISTQEELCDLLTEAGYKVTQATVSRDIREMKIIKLVLADGRQIYGIPASEMARDRKPEKSDRIMREIVVSIDYANNIVVIKADAGMGPAVGATIDAMEFPEMLGSIAGDDTLMCVMRSEEAAADLTKMIKKMILEY